MAEELTATELAERVATLRKLRSLLEAQRNKFREYLVVLEKQQIKIEADDGEALRAHAELGTQIVESIASLQKAIMPMRALYESAAASDTARASADIAAECGNVAQLQTELAGLRERVLQRNEHNRALLKVHMNRLREQLADFGLHNPYRGRRSVYADKEYVGSRIAMEV